MRADDWLLRQLPVTMTEDDFFRRFLSIFQSVADTVLQQIDNLANVFDPAVAPPSMVREMGRWIGIDWLDAERDPALQRRIVLTYSALLHHRGTRAGLVALLELISGEGNVTVKDSGGIYRIDEAPQVGPHVTVDMTEVGWAREDDVIRIVRDELPATATFRLRIGGVLVWPKRADGDGRDDGDGGDGGAARVGGGGARPVQEVR